MPPESSVVIPREEHIANVELEECEPQPDGHVIAVDIVWVHSVLHALTTRSASVRTPWSLCDEQRQRGNSLCGKPPPKAATRKRCANVKSEAEASQRDWVAGPPPEQLPARAALIWRQIGRLAPREPGEIRGLVTSLSEAPLEKVSFTTLLYVSPVRISCGIHRHRFTFFGGGTTRG